MRIARITAARTGGEDPVDGLALVKILVDSADAVVPPPIAASASRTVTAILALRARAQRSPPCGGDRKGVATKQQVAVITSNKDVAPLCLNEISLGGDSAFVFTPLPVPPPQGGREPCGTDLRKSARNMAEPLLPHHVDQNSIRISQPMLPQGAAACDSLSSAAPPCRCAPARARAAVSVMMRSTSALKASTLSTLKPI